MKHPIQHLCQDKDGRVQFQNNPIVEFLLDAGPFDLNQLALMPFDDEDREQLAQLIGYSLSGFGELSYASDEAYEEAVLSLKEMVNKSKKIGYELRELIESEKNNE